MMIILPEAKVNELKTLMETAGIDTCKELFNNSLTLFEWALDEVRSGKVIASLDERTDRHRVLVMPVLERIAKAARKAELPTTV